MQNINLRNVIGMIQICRWWPLICHRSCILFFFSFIGVKFILNKLNTNKKKPTKKKKNNINKQEKSNG